MALGVGREMCAVSMEEYEYTERRVMMQAEVKEVSSREEFGIRKV